MLICAPFSFDFREQESIYKCIQSNVNIIISYFLHYLLSHTVPCYCTAPDDYDASSSPYTVTFVPGQMTANITVDTFNDNITELTEQFKAILTIPATSSSIGVIKGSTDILLVNILDNGGHRFSIMLLCCLIRTSAKCITHY